MKKSTIVTASILAVVIGAAGVTAAVVTGTPPAPIASSENPQPMTSQDEAEELEQESEIATQASSTNDLLLYLIEEEKLAHDVYTVLGETWGGNTFSNILASETSHQDQVLNLLNSYGLTDPRSSEIGVFVNPDLQALYDQLIAQGMTSQTEAYKVGVLIEETDITDLTTAINSTSDATIVATLEKLRSASESHLAAFSKKL
ncbi:hypothetical protein M2118_001541 [Aurantimicrobium minutum]|uniref:ferritin-like domain-containing protein n=1 Tax=Aurantimicrobium minutum TaxID=708131 RepID=UPI002472FC89|nr:DUF2202 domain-containing protein [Aurantimicrobium minutum]MDH6278557.1 hypothetical protein [Aurantimicrobium minutum]